MTFNEIDELKSIYDNNVRQLQQCHATIHAIKLKIAVCERFARAISATTFANSLNSPRRLKEKR
jgi:hypothetical protein